MSWHRKYWDTIDQLYWNPSLLGLPSIPKGEWQVDQNWVCVPKERIRNGGSLYARNGTAAENAARMRRLEEPLNHIFDIAFGIVSSSTIEHLLLQPFGWRDVGKFESLGREIATRYNEFANSNATQQDGYFVSDQTLLGVELKLASKTWPGQVLKYLSLMVAEERLSGKRKSIGLLFITPNADSSTVFREGGIDGHGSLPKGFVQIVTASQKNVTIQRMLDDFGSDFEDAAGRLVCKHLSWQQFAASVRQYAAEQENSAGGATLKNVLEGLAAGIEEQVGTIA